MGYRSQLAGLQYVFSFSLTPMMTSSLFVEMRVPANSAMHLTALRISCLVTFIAAYLHAVEATACDKRLGGEDFAPFSTYPC